uniref:DNA topoisomerase (ATP-hydrolyzing) n=1 Tax=Trichuris muris TaxID=70415 RepID=A0A5S6QRI1_TRIMR
MLQDNHYHEEMANQEILERVENCLFAFQSSLVHGPKPLLFLPGNRRSSMELSWRNGHLFTAVCCVLAEVHSLLRTNTFRTKRSIFYKHRHLFRTQRDIDVAIGLTCNILEASRFQLHILSTSRGLIAGDLVLETRKREMIDCRIPTSIPTFPEHFSIRCCSAKFVLIVEKDSVFQKLAYERTIEPTLSAALIVTAKGYPDFSTRLFLNALNERAQLPMVALMDADSYGIEIFLNYKYGPSRISHESGSNILLPNTQWLGIYPSEIERFELAGAHKLPLTQRDKKHITNLQHRFGDDTSINEELKRLAAYGHKIEVEALCSLGPHYLTQKYLRAKLERIQYANDGTMAV